MFLFLQRKKQVWLLERRFCHRALWLAQIYAGQCNGGKDMVLDVWNHSTPWSHWGKQARHPHGGGDLECTDVERLLNRRGRCLGTSGGKKQLKKVSWISPTAVKAAGIWTPDSRVQTLCSGCWLLCTPRGLVHTIETLKLTWSLYSRMLSLMKLCGDVLPNDFSHTQMTCLTFLFEVQCSIMVWELRLQLRGEPLTPWVRVA